MDARELTKFHDDNEEDSDLAIVGRPHTRWGSWTRSLAVIVAIGLIALVTFLVAWGAAPGLSPSPSQPGRAQVKQQIIVVPTCSYDTQKVCPASALFHNPEVHEVAVDNLMKVGRGLLKDVDKNLVRIAVKTGFNNISFELQKQSPEVAMELGMMELSEVQKDAVISSMRLMSDPRVQSIGRDIGQAIRNSKSIDRAELKRRIQAKLQPRFSEIKNLRSEVMPAPLQQAWGEGQQWTMTLDKENIRVMGSYHGEAKYGAIRKNFGSYAHKNELTPFSLMTYSILGGVLEEGRALLDIIELCGRHIGKHLEVPYWVTHLGGNMEVTSELLSCEHHFVNPNRLDIKLNSTSALFCPLKFGTQGMDALKAAAPPR